MRVIGMVVSAVHAEVLVDGMTGVMDVVERDEVTVGVVAKDDVDAGVESQEGGMPGSRITT